MAKAAKKEQEEPQQKRCFIITPIGSDDSNIRREADGLIDAVIMPVLDDLDIVGEVAHRINKTGNINKQVITRLIDYELVIANLTGLNPNVMYELAIRHAKRKPVVSLAIKGTNLPFDIHAERTLMYVNDMAGVEDLKPRLINAIKEAIDEEEPDNPVYDAITDNIMKEVVLANSDNPQKLIFEKIEELNDKIQRISSKEESNSIIPVPSFELYIHPADIKVAHELLLKNDIHVKDHNDTLRFRGYDTPFHRLSVHKFSSEYANMGDFIEKIAYDILRNHQFRVRLV